MNKNLQKRIYALLTDENNKARTGTGTQTRDRDENTNTNDTTSVSTSEYDVEPFTIINNFEASANDTSLFEAQNTRILGMPHQFLSTADMRIDENKNFGYCFAKDIYMEKPILTLMPGKPNYLPDYSAADKKIFGSLASEFNNENSKSVLEQLISDHGETRYYDFKSDYTRYITYVNLMCRVAAIFLGIGNEKGPDGVTLYKHYNWANYQSFVGYSVPESVKDNGDILKAAEDYFENLKDDLTHGQRCYVNFFMDPSTTISENISNSTQKSQLEGAFDSMEGIVKEANMLLNSISSAGSEIGNFVSNAGEAILGLADTVTLGLFKNMLGLAEKEVLHGANLIFPEVWMDSEYSKSYSITMNFISPYGDDEAIYLNILVPIIHALCLALPRQSSANSFSSPFIVRGYSPGWFSIDMGMVEQIQIDKGPEQSWNVRGLPTQAKVTMTIKDLYSQLMISPSNKPFLFLANQGLIDYLGSMCGMDLTEPNIVLKVQVVRALLFSKVADIVPNTSRKLRESFLNKMKNLSLFNA